MVKFCEDFLCSMALRGQEGEDWCWEVSGGRIDGGSQSHLGRLGEEPGHWTEQDVGSIYLPSFDILII